MDDAEIQQLTSAGLIEEIDPMPSLRQLMPQLGRWLEKLILKNGELPSSIDGLGSPRGVPPDYWAGVCREIVAALKITRSRRRRSPKTWTGANALFMAFVPPGWPVKADVQDQIYATVDSAIKRARSRLAEGESLLACEGCGESIPRSAAPSIAGRPEVRPVPIRGGPARRAPEPLQPPGQQGQPVEVAPPIA